MIWQQQKKQSRGFGSTPYRLVQIVLIGVIIRSYDTCLNITTKAKSYTRISIEKSYRGLFYIYCD